MESIRKPIISVLGHVDHGKTSLLDSIRGSTVVEREAGAITQAIGASIIPLDSVKRICGDLLKKLGLDLKIPGLLFIDTPGHEAFNTLRKRGGSLADIAILVVDINENLMPQTIEAIEILKHSKTPFVIAANKIDLVEGSKLTKGPLLSQLTSQSPEYIRKFEMRFYELVGKVYERGFQADRFDRLDDYTKQIAIVPVSAKLGLGIPELLMVITGLTQKYLEACLKCDVSGPGKGVVLEVKEEQGMGTTVDVILFDGSIKRNDTIVVGSLQEPIVAKVRALLEPKALSEMMDKKVKYDNVQQVFAATGVKISAPGLDGVVAGMPLRVASDATLEAVKQEISAEVSEVLMETDNEGVIVKADSLGSVEALIFLLRKAGFKIRKASVGEISKKDISEAASNFEKDPFSAVIVGFNVAIAESLPENVKVITGNVIYKILDDLAAWKEELKKREEAKQLDLLIRPCKIKLMQNYLFRQSNPAVIGVEIIAGSLKSNTPLMKDGQIVASVKSIQAEQEKVDTAKEGQQVAISLPDVTIGRQLKGDEILYSAISDETFKKFKEFKHLLSRNEIEILKEIAIIMRKSNPVWGI